MEHTILLVLIGSSVLITLLSFDLKNVIMLRFISAMFLILSAYAITTPTLFVGFGSQNVIPYSASSAGDPGRAGEIQAFTLGFGFLGFIQIIYGFLLIIQLAFSPSSNGGLNPDADGYV